MPQVASAVLSGGRSAGISGGSGYRLDRDGVQFARGVLGDLASTNFVAGENGRGWILRGDGSGELNSVVVNLANVRGTLTASHVSADVRNWFLLRSATATIPLAYDSRLRTGPDVNLSADGTNYDMIFVSGSMGDYFIQTFIPSDELSSLRQIADIFWTTSRFLIGAKTHQLSLSVRLNGSKLETQTYADDAGGSATIDQVWGVNSPVS